jgi:CHASE1-domain containing sensor protein
MIEAAIEQRLQSHINVLRGVVGLFDASGDVPATGWERYLRAVRPETSAAGLQGIGFSARVSRAERSSFERRFQEQRWPFAIWPANDRDELHAVVYVHPITPENLRALGYDMFTEPVRRDADDARARPGRTVVEWSGASGPGGLPERGSTRVPVVSSDLRHQPAT